MFDLNAITEFRVKVTEVLQTLYSMTAAGCSADEVFGQAELDIGQYLLDNGLMMPNMSLSNTLPESFEDFAADTSAMIAFFDMDTQSFVGVLFDSQGYISVRVGDFDELGEQLPVTLDEVNEAWASEATHEFTLEESKPRTLH